jgi:outer membrane receptor protein involved in Fe transport
MFTGKGRGILGLSLLLWWCGSVAATAQDAVPETTAPVEGSEAAEARVEEELFVEASLPYVPSTSSVATKLPMDLAWTPANVGVLDLGLLAEQDGVVMGDVLGQVSGMLTQTGGGVFDFFTLRGYDSLNGALLSIDGVGEPESTFYPLYNLERIEVFKGPASFLYGSNALAGTRFRHARARRWQLR